jgi:hypothetical protein
MSVELDIRDEESGEHLEAATVDNEGEIIYDPNAARPDYKLFTLR